MRLKQACWGVRGFEASGWTAYSFVFDLDQEKCPLERKKRTDVSTLSTQYCSQRCPTASRSCSGAVSARRRKRRPPLWSQRMRESSHLFGEVHRRCLLLSSPTTPAHAVGHPDAAAVSRVWHASLRVPPARTRRHAVPPYRTSSGTPPSRGGLHCG